MKTCKDGLVQFPYLIDFAWGNYKVNRPFCEIDLLAKEYKKRPKNNNNIQPICL